MQSGTWRALACWGFSHPEVHFAHLFDFLALCKWDERLNGPGLPRRWRCWLLFKNGSDAISEGKKMQQSQQNVLNNVQWLVLERTRIWSKTSADFHKYIKRTQSIDQRSHQGQNHIRLMKQQKHQSYDGGTFYDSDIWQNMTLKPFGGTVNVISVKPAHL